jgi:elongation factor 1-beta
MEYNVIAKMRVMPASVETDLEKVKTEISKAASKYGKLHSTEVKPIAFGLSAVEATFLMEDKSGGMDELEAEIRKINGVGEVELLEASRI